MESLPRIQNRHILWKIPGVSGDQGEPMLKGGGGEEAVHEGKFSTGSLVFGVKAAPNTDGSHIHHKEPACGPAFDSLIPLLDFLAAVSLIHEMDALQHFSQGQDADVEFRIMIAKPIHDDGIRPGP